MPPLLIFDCRKRNRIHGYDYSQNNYYFVTVNTHESIYWLGKVVDGEMKLNKIGKIVNDCLTNIPNYAEFCEIDAFIVMPNHLHVIIVINDRLVGDDLLVVPMGQTRRFVPTVKRKSVSEIVKNFKTYSSKIIHEKFPNVSFQWQRSFYDHVIRNEFALGRIRQYILNNPPKWEFDRNNFESKIPLKKRGAW